MKDIYGLLNEVNLDFSDIEEVEVSEIERERGKRKLMGSLRKRKNTKKKISVAIASIAILSIVSITVAKPTWAQNIPIIGHLMQNSLINENGKYSDYMNTIGQTKSQKGIDVTYETVVVDNNMFTLILSEKNNNAEFDENSKEFDDLNTSVHLNINGKDIDMNGYSTKQKAVNKNTVQFLCQIPLDYKELPKNLDVKIKIPIALNERGDWGAEFSMNTKDIENSNYEEKLSKTINVNGIDFSLNEITISPLTTNIKYDAKCEEYMMDFLILDQDGNEVKSAMLFGMDECDGDGKNKFSWTYNNNEKVNSLKIIPRYHDDNYIEKKLGSKKIDLNKFLPFDFNLTDNMSINIENVTVDGEYLIVKHKYKYLGKTVDRMSGKDLVVKAGGVPLEEPKRSEVIEHRELFKKYESNEDNINIYKIGNAKEVEMEFYDATVHKLLEDEAFTVTKK